MSATYIALQPYRLDQIVVETGDYIFLQILRDSQCYQHLHLKLQHLNFEVWQYRLEIHMLLLYIQVCHL